MIQSIDSIRNALQLLNTRNPDGLQVLSAVSSIPRARLVQIMNGEGEPPTMMEATTINMLKGA